jgi:hypothetical protein
MTLCDRFQARIVEQARGYGMRNYGRRGKN